MESLQQGQPSRRAIAITPAGIVGTLILAAVVIAFIRLGFWQLRRLGERRELNAAVAARLHSPPLSNAGQLTDTAGIHYRRVRLTGTFDNDRSIVLAGRSHRGVPGVYLITPLQLDGRTAVLVHRGWVASPDAATVDFTRLELPGTGVSDALVVPFPSTAASLAERDSVPAAAGFRRVWFTIHQQALRAQFPYRLLPVMLQELPDSSGARRSSMPGRAAPTRLGPPALDEGSHLGYALQWFSFALIGIIGWIALVMRGRRQTAAAAFAMLALGLAPKRADAQLRPLDGLEWRVFDNGIVMVGAAGMGVLWDIPAPLTGASGRLVEAGNYSVALRSGRIAIEASGTALWHFKEMRRTSTAANGVEPATDGARRDAGVATVATAFRASLPGWTTDLVLRFGASIPTTSDESGLDRDRTDFFATVGLRYPRGNFSFWMENGIGINGTTSPEYPQSDVWTFSFGTAYAMGPLRPSASLVGRQDGHSWIVRGNEDQHELRLGVDVGSARWLSVQYIRGLSEFSPQHGLRLNVGTAFGAR